MGQHAPARISPEDVGQRVVVRRRLSGQTGPSGGQAYADVLGILETCAGDIIRIRRADDTLVEISVADVARLKRIPPPPRKRRP